MRACSVLWVLLLALSAHVCGQETKSIQLSGTLLDAESLEPLPFASVLIKNSNRGTVANAGGFFTLLAQTADAIQFSIVGYMPTQLRVPAGLTGEGYALIKLMQKETVVLQELEVYPWPSALQFQQAFLGECSVLESVCISVPRHFPT